MLNKINQDDSLRVLATEVTPFETPLLFSNTGFYKNYKEKDNIPSFLVGLIEQKADDYSIPFNFKIDKDANSHRVLSLIHPSLQLDVASFYDVFSSRILNSCSVSDFSIRYPSKKASRYYTSEHAYTEEHLKSDVVEFELENNQYQNSYFSYKKFQHINFFTSSTEFLYLEEKFKFLLKLDVQACFDSIYTHSICWSVKDKKFAKNNAKKNLKTFENEFDCLMSKINYNETNGIITGPEFSRIFSEVILQGIDSEIYKNLEKLNIICGVDYELRRYVDDYFVFSNNIDKLNIIEREIVDVLHYYKLSVNKSKRVFQERPFYTSKDIAIDKVRELIKSVNIKITELKPMDDKFIRLPSMKRIKRENVVPQFIRDVKSVIKEVGVGLLDITAYIQKSLGKLIYSMIDKYQFHSLKISNDDFEYFASYFDIILYFYSLDRRTSTSFSFCQLIITLNDFSKRKSLIYSHYFRDKLSHYLQLKILQIEHECEEGMKIEVYNLALTLEYVSENLQESLPNISFNKLNELKSYNYFDFICLMYIAGKNKSLSHYIPTLTIKTETYMDNIINDIGFKSAELIHMLLDYLSCPFISSIKKINYLKKIIVIGDLKKQLSRKNVKFSKDNVSLEAELQIIIDYSTNRYWFSNWDKVDIWNLLIKKQLNPTY
ncbi:antiviral reverse transcriptase Drt3b [Pseudoalteromonas agarivorans]|uniref:RNA-directed DNA polymerase n=1 Tax=Pseudoalteromonas agarivorans TaxID=176102 RepID=A0AAD0TYQ9_9GAMM|nr:antiviral reverse transcriptase Drt3b [Pseudoalteromonas agarivorans]AYM86899.1 RNA-directed DNA polymerase [Pseudoalteromonas agarivorans]